MKICTKCKIHKDLSDFYKSGTGTDGRNSWCKKCCSASCSAENKKKRADKKAANVADVQAALNW